MGGEGYGTNSGEMAGVANSIRGLAEPLTAEGKKIATTEVAAADFGRAHTGAGAAYTAGLQKLSNCVLAYKAAMDDFAARLEHSRGGYDWAETTNTAGANDVGGQ